MDGTRRLWTVITLGGLLVGWALLIERPLLLLGAAGLAAWLLTIQLQAVRAFKRASAVEVTYVADTRRVTTNQPIRCRFTVERAEPADTQLTATAPLPLAAEGADDDTRTVTLAPGETRAATTVEFTIPVAGRFECDTPTLHVEESHGLFTERFPRGDAPTFDVTADAPRTIHVGRGGDQVLTPYGEHATDRRGAGLLPEELREYVTSDPADSIDWKATARLNEPYVREYQAETDRETILVVDHRATMTQGRGGETMLAYAREVALGVARTAIDASDPLGLYAVGDAGLTTRIPPTTAPNGYTRIQNTVQTLSATTATDTAPQATAPAQARRIATHLADADADDRFATQLRPFLTAQDAYVRRLAGDPLFGAVEALATGADSNQLTVIITSDVDPARLRETVELAARRSASVLVFLTPQVLFERATVLDTAYERYTDFEELRRSLDRLPRVTAFEVGPGDQVRTLLASRTNPRQLNRTAPDR